MHHRAKLVFMMLAGLFMSLGLAQQDANGEAGDAATNGATETPQVSVAEHDVLGSYLTDQDGRALYTLVREDAALDAQRTTEGVSERAAPCTATCALEYEALEATDVTAGEGIDDELLYVADVDGNSQVVYNGFPLYRYYSDLDAGYVTGRGHAVPPFEWHLVSPEGGPVQLDQVRAEGDGTDQEGVDAVGGDDAVQDETDAVGGDDAVQDDAAQDGATGAEGDDAMQDDAAQDDAAQDGAAGAEGDDAVQDDGTQDGAAGAEGDDAVQDDAVQDDAVQDDATQDGATGAEGDDAVQDDAAQNGAAGAEGDDAAQDGATGAEGDDANGDEGERD